LFALVVVLSLFTFGCTTSSQVDPETLRVAEREAELDRKMEAMRIAVQILEGSNVCQTGGYASEELFNDYCLGAIEKAYHFIIETVMQEGR
jgi:hypothetical protein